MGRRRKARATVAMTAVHTANRSCGWRCGGGRVEVIVVRSQECVVFVRGDIGDVWYGITNYF